MENEEIKTQKNEEEWKKKLTPEEHKILRERGTEMPFSGEYVHAQNTGMYVCKACGFELFSSDSKFDSGTGWPSFDKPAGLLSEKPDSSRGMERTEVICSRCGSHLGHVFGDGPTDTGKRYCINSCALGFEKKDGEVSEKRRDDGENAKK